GALPDGIAVKVLTDPEAAEAQRHWAHVLVDAGARDALLDGTDLTTVVVPYAGVPEKLRHAVLARAHLTVRTSHYTGRMVRPHAAHVGELGRQGRSPQPRREPRRQESTAPRLRDHRALVGAHPLEPRHGGDGVRQERQGGRRRRGGRSGRVAQSAWRSGRTRE